MEYELGISKKNKACKALYQVLYHCQDEQANKFQGQ
jgi:hypothetical protein